MFGMIPKKIHYCWLSGEAFPETVKQCMESWHKYMPDWEYVLWDMERAKDIDSVWLKECIEARKWAFAADFIRIYALYHEGGVYLDSDVMIFQPLEPFLQHRFFIGREGVQYATFDDGVQVFLTSHCFGAEKGHPYLKRNLGYYQDRHFRASSCEDLPNLLRYDMLMLPYIQSRLAETCGYDPALDADHMQQLTDGMVVYPACYFGSNPYRVDPATCYAEHLGQGSWREPEYWAKHKPMAPINWRYKVRWRVVRLLVKWARKMDYVLVRIHPDGRE